MTTATEKNIFGEPLPTKLQVGDILQGDFGYSMILPAFYKITDITKSGKSARVRRLSTRNSSSDGGWTGTCVPADEWWGPEEGKLHRIRLVNWGRGQEYAVTIRDHTFRLWDGTPKHFDHFD